MGKFIEIKAFVYDSCEEKRVYPLLLNLSKVTAVCREDNECHVYTDDARFHVPEKSYGELCKALQSYTEENSDNKLCELQHDHTWIKQAVCNLIAMMKKGNTDYKPALLVGCNDKELDTMFSDCYNKVRKMQEHIKELEKQVEIKTEPKKGK
jgi:hypothetical protein